MAQNNLSGQKGSGGFPTASAQHSKAPQMDPALLEQMNREEQAQAYVRSLPSISVRTSGNKESAGVGMDERLRLLMQQEAEMKQISKMTES